MDYIESRIRDILAAHTGVISRDFRHDFEEEVTKELVALFHATADVSVKMNVGSNQGTVIGVWK